MGTADGVTVYDDFAHHPTAVAETLAGLRASNPTARIWAVFEPRSASSCRRVFQDDFARAFAGADEVLIAPVFRSTLPDAERLSVPSSCAICHGRVRPARESRSIDDIVDTIVREHRPGDLVVIMSNGGFGGIHQKLLRALAVVTLMSVQHRLPPVTPRCSSEFDRAHRPERQRAGDCALATRLRRAAHSGRSRLVPTYRNRSRVYFDPLATDVDRLAIAARARGRGAVDRAGRRR